MLKLVDRLLFKALPQAQAAAACTPGSYTTVVCSCTGSRLYTKTCQLDYYCNTYNCGGCRPVGACG